MCRPEYAERMKIETIVRDSMQRVIETILKNSMTDPMGDGKIFTYSISDMPDISSGESGEKAL